MVSPVLHFGKHKHQPLPEVPTSYLCWVLREVKLSSGLRAAIVGELARRGQKPPSVPPPTPPLPCPHCGGRLFRCAWIECSNGVRQIRADCVRCWKSCGLRPQVEPYLSEANRNASPTALLDALVRIEALGLILVSDGRSCHFHWADWQRVPPDLAALVRQCSHQLAGLIGDNRKDLEPAGQASQPDPGAWPAAERPAHQHPPSRRP